VVIQKDDTAHHDGAVTEQVHPEGDIHRENEHFHGDETSSSFSIFGSFFGRRIMVAGR